MWYRSSKKKPRDGLNVIGWNGYKHIGRYKIVNYWKGNWYSDNKALYPFDDIRYWRIIPRQPTWRWIVHRLEKFLKKMTRKES